MSDRPTANRVAPADQARANAHAEWERQRAERAARKADRPTERTNRMSKAEQTDLRRHAEHRAELAQIAEIESSENVEFPVDVEPVSQTSPRRYRDREHLKKLTAVIEHLLVKRAASLRKRGYTLETDASEPVPPTPEPPKDANGAATTVQAKIAELEAKIESVKGKPEFSKVAAAARGQITKLRKQLPTSNRPDPVRVAAGA